MASLSGVRRIRDARLLKRLRSTVWMLAVIGSFAGSIAETEAQTTPPTADTGFQPNRDYLALLPWESIDTVSGNVVLTFTDLELPGNGGRSLRFQRIFNNMLPGIGATHWTFGIAGVPMRLVQSSGSLVYVVMPDGSYARVQPEGSASSDWLVTAQFGRYFKPEQKLFLPDGLVVQYDNGRPIAFYVRNANGQPTNVTNLDWSTNHLVVTQNVGADSRVVEIDFDGATGTVTKMEYNDQTTTRTWEYDLDETYPDLIETATLADGSTWTFEYESFAGAGTKVTDVTTPQGGHVNYDYDTKDFPYGENPALTIAHEVVLVSREIDGPEIDGGTWTFDYGNGDGAPMGMKATLPSGNRIWYDYASLGVSETFLAGGWGMTYRRVLPPVAEGDTAIETEARDYVPLRVVVNAQIWTVPALSWISVTRNSTVYRTDFTYENDGWGSFADYHHPRVKTERVGSAVRRVTEYTYEHLVRANGLTLYMVGLPRSEQVLVNGETATSLWSYDQATGFRRGESIHGVATTFEPDAFGNVAVARKANGKETNFTYRFGRVEGTHTAEVDTLREINADGTVAWESQGGRTTLFKYDELFRVKLVCPPGTGDCPPSSPGDANATATEYNGRTITVTRGSSEVQTELDGFGRPIATHDTVSGIRTRTELDAEGRVAQRSLPYTGSSPVWTQFEYDPLGRVMRELFADGNDVTRSYGAETVTVVDELDQETVLTYQAFGHPDDRRLKSVLDAEDKLWEYEYNVIGNLTKVKADDDVERLWNYDASNPTRLISETHPESGTVTYVQYDEAGVLKTRRDAKGTQFQYRHDGNDRVTGITAGDQITTITYEDGTDNRRTITVGGISTTFYYEDETGRLYARDDALDGRIFTRRFEYDGNGNMTKVTYPSGRRVQFDFDNANRLEEIRDLTASRTVASDFDYHASGALATYKAGNNVTTTITYHPTRYWVESITAGVLNLDYTYYAGGNVETITDSRGGVYSQAFTYDALDRLESFTGMGSGSFSYDLHGNRTGSDYTHSSTTLRLTQQVLGGVTRTFAYDNNGNLTGLTAGPAVSFTYTPDNQVASATANSVTTRYEYDGDQWRIRKESGGVPSYFLRGAAGELLTEVTDAGGGSLEFKDYIYAGSRLVSAVTATVTGGLCSAVLTPGSRNAVAAGETVNVAVAIGSTCAWTAVSPVPWTAVTSGGSGTGSGTVTLTVSENPFAQSRQAVVNIAGRPFAVSQEGHESTSLGDRLLEGPHMLPGMFLTSPNGYFTFKLFTSGVVSLTGPSGEFTRSGTVTSEGAGWAAMEDGRFVVRDVHGAEVWSWGDSGHPGAFIAMQNDRNVVIYNQAGTQALWSWNTACSYVPKRLYMYVNGSGETRELDVDTSVDCPWTTSSPESWVTVSEGASVLGNGTAEFTIAANPGLANRRIEVEIANHTLVIEQGGAPGSLGTHRLESSERISLGQWLESPSGNYHLKLSSTGVLTIDTGAGTPVWGANGEAVGLSFVEMWADGRLALVDEFGRLKWWTPTEGNYGAYAEMRDDGKLALYSASRTLLREFGPAGACNIEVYIEERTPSAQESDRVVNISAPDHCEWSVSANESWIDFTSATTGFGSAEVPFTVLANASPDERVAMITVTSVTSGGQEQDFLINQGGQRPAATDTLRPNESLRVGDSLTSSDGRYTMVYQTDGNLVIRGPESDDVVWHSHTHGQNPGFVVMQDNGEFAIYDGFSGSQQFTSNSGGHPGAYVVLQNDGNLVVYDAAGGPTYYWASFEHP